MAPSPPNSDLNDRVQSVPRVFKAQSVILLCAIRESLPPGVLIQDFQQLTPEAGESSAE